MVAKFNNEVCYFAPFLIQAPFHVTKAHIHFNGCGQRHAWLPSAHILWQQSMCTRRAGAGGRPKLLQVDEGLYLRPAG